MQQLEPAIAQFIQAQNSHDTATALAFFDPEAVVLAQNQVWVGHAGILSWQQQQPARLQLEITAVRRHCGEFYLQTRWHSAVNATADCQFVFALQDGKISRLIVQSQST
ncbi:nuclear transport factor 2 family protein [Rheinheimera muenzenbergensis]|uniref:Nuclear transport factor 2 family protein n=1 Tax=Rheinheimera muenzenbergensis TaxID=1193628 RepID=A0ABU8C2P3_9GAMM